MTQGIPVASKLLDSKVMGVSARKLAESLGPPIVPVLVLYTLGAPLIMTFPAIIVGAIIGAVIYHKTPPGQQPIRYASSVIRHYRGQNIYVWQRPAETEDDLGYGEPENVWLTRPVSTEEEPDPYWPVGTANSPTDGTANLGDDN